MRIRYKSRSNFFDMPDYSLDLIHFGQADFNYVKPPCTIEEMDKYFLKKLDLCRSMCGFHFPILSAFIDEKRARLYKQSKEYYHSRGRAVLVRYDSPAQLAAIVRSALYCGLNGVGVYPHAVHLDDRPVSAIWYGKADDPFLCPLPSDEDKDFPG